MSLLLDTNVFLWAVAEQGRLKKHVIELLEDGNEALYVSAVTACEIAIKWTLGKIELPGSPADFFKSAVSHIGGSQLSITASHGAGLAALPYHHRDPWDRLLIAQAQATGFRVITSDREFGKYDIEVVLN